MAKLKINHKKKAVRIDTTLENVKDGVYIVALDEDYIVMKNNGVLFRFCNNEDGSCPSNIVVLSRDSWKDTKALYLVENLYIEYDLKRV